MPQDRTVGRDGGNIRRSKLLRIALSGAVAVLAVCACSAARAGDDDVSSKQSFTDKFMNTLGLKNPFDPQYGINYSERSPLVVPPTRTLPAPVSANAMPAPNWPKDPDIRKRQAAKDYDKPEIRPYDSVEHSARALTPAELGVGRAGSTVPAPGVGEQTTRDTGTKKSLFSFDWLKQEQYATFTGEPARASLTDPPPGYQTPSPDQPYGIAPEKKVYKPPSLGERMELQR
jgi:hypothetical protein